MATLEKIRSKSALLVIVIGLALLAFIIGDAITNSRNLFGDRTTVAKVDGVKIDYNDFTRKREELQQQFQNNPSVDPQLLSQMALEQLIQEALLDKAVKEAGIQVSSEHLKMQLFDNGMTMPEMQQLLQTMNANGMNVATPQQAYDFIFNPKAHGMTQAQMAQYQSYWMNMENTAKQQIGRQIYGQLLFGAINANDLDAKYLFEDDRDGRNLTLAFKPFGEIEEKKFPVTDAEIKAEYDKNKAKYRIDQEMKRISLIAVTVNPSDADQKDSKALSDNTVATLKADTTGSAAKALQKDGVTLTPYRVVQKQIPVEFRSFVTSAPKDSVGKVKENITGFSVAKMGKKEMATDSIQINIVTVAAPSLVAKVKDSLNGGLAIDSLTTKFPADSVMTNKEVWFAQISSQQARLTQAQLDTLLAAGSNYIIMQEDPMQGAVLAKVTEVRPQVEVFNFEVATYDLIPSQATLTSEVSKLQNFIDKNKTADAFNKEAAKAGYQVAVYNVTANTPALPLQSNAEIFSQIPLQAWGPLYEGSSQVVGWVVRDGKAGKVGPMFESQDKMRPILYAVAVNEVFDDYVPVSVLKDQLTAQVRKNKAGEAMVKEFSGKGDINATATAMGVTPQELTAFTMNNGIAQVRDGKVVGQICGTKAGNNVVLTVGENGVYAFTVKSVEANPAQKFDADTYAMKYRQQMLNFNPSQLLIGSHKVKNNIYNFIELQSR